MSPTDSSTTANISVIRRLYETRDRIQTSLWLARVPVIKAQLRAMRATAG